MCLEEIKTIFCLHDLKVKKHKEAKILSQVLSKEDITSISACIDGSIYKGQQSVKKLSLHDYSNLFCKGERKTTGALRGTQAEFETISLSGRKICYTGLIEFLPDQELVGQCSVSPTRNL